MVHRVEIEFAGRTLSLETGRLAGLANGAVLVRYGDTVVLTTAVTSDEPREGIDFFPLTVEFEEKMYAVGKFPGGFIKREGRPSETAILSARLTDRPIRPLFPKEYRNDVQVITTVLSADQVNDPAILSIIGASAALTISDIPFYGPVGAVKLGFIEGEVVVNPTLSQLQYSDLDLTLAGTADAILMVEAGAKELPEQEVLRALEIGHQAIRPLIELQERLRELAGKPKRPVPQVALPAELVQEVRDFLGSRLEEAIYNPDKAGREDATRELKKETVAHFADRYDPREVSKVFEGLEKETVRTNILEKGLRPDRRGLSEIRPISCEVGVLPRTHGSGLFTRGQTQVLSVATLGTEQDVQLLDSIWLEESKRYMHHYNFPPFSTGETRPVRGPSRRDIGHGALAERALEAVLPDEEEFPYTIRVVSEVLSSNGSTSMASTCGSTLALMDAGVPIRAPVAGVAMGLITGPGGDLSRHAILTDIQGIEDMLGDMDFKVAGTEAGITALQMDIKVRGITMEILRKALEQAREGRLFILDKMRSAISQVRAEISPHAPRMYKITIPPEKIREVIGPGGKVIRQIQSETKTSINIEDDGTVIIGATSAEAAHKAEEMIRRITREVEVGAIYTGKVTRIMNFGAFVEILPGKDGLIHISELAPYRVNRVEDVVNVGDEVTVVVTEIDRQGRINLSRRRLLEAAEEPAPDGAGEEGQPAPRERGGRREGRGSGVPERPSGPPGVPGGPPRGGREERGPRRETEPAGGITRGPAPRRGPGGPPAPGRESRPLREEGRLTREGGREVGPAPRRGPGGPAGPGGQRGPSRRERDAYGPRW